MVCPPVHAEEPIEDLYTAVFRYGTKVMRPLEVRIALIKMNSFKTGLQGDDSRREEVAFWLEAGVNVDSKCNGRDDQVMRSHFDMDKTRAQEYSYGHGGIFNLEAYLEDVRLERLLYCEHRFGSDFIRELTEWNMVNNNYKDAHDLLSGHGHQMDAHRIGKRVAGFMRSRADPVVVEHLEQSAIDIEFVKEQYRRLSPCAGIMGIVRRYEGYYSLLAAPGRSVRPVLRNWMQKIAVCRFIELSEQVFIDAAMCLRQDPVGLGRHSQ